jgi:predicted acylesterase/phospholipase RssA
MPDKIFRVLSLDGGGAKGFYTLGILREIEAMIGCRLHERFDLIFGTSTGSIITAMLALGKGAPEIITLYQDHVPTVMKNKNADGRSRALAELSKAIFGDAMFTDVKTSVGIVATKWVLEKPMIFKTHIGQAHGMKGSFVPGFGVKISDAVQASCSAYPYFNRKTIVTSNGDSIELIDGGFCANNPTLYAIADATVALGILPENIRLVSLGCGNYPPPPLNWWTTDFWKQKTPGVQMLQKTLEINTQSMNQLRVILHKNIQTIRISQSFPEPAMATDLFEHDMKKLDVLKQRGAQSFAENEQMLGAFLL